MLHDTSEITKRLFIWGVCAVAIIPRQHIVRTQCSVGGGNMSNAFRKLLLASVTLNLVRLVFRLMGVPRLISDIVGIVQVVSLSFLCFLTPYILQTWLAPRINIGGRPGADLMLPLYLTAILSISGVILSKLVHPNLWCLNRLCNVVTGPPVLRTLKMYNSATSLGDHAGRGTILCQTLVVIEWWHMLTQLLCAIGYAALDRNKAVSEYTLLDVVLKGFHDIAFSSIWTRVMAHAIFINLLDELYLTSPPPETTDKQTNKLLLMSSLPSGTTSPTDEEEPTSLDDGSEGSIPEATEMLAIVVD